MTDKTLVLDGGPFFVARRKPGTKSWEVNDNGFETLAEVEAYIATAPKDYEYSWADMSQEKPTQISRTTGTKQ